MCVCVCDEGAVVVRCSRARARICESAEWLPMKVLRWDVIGTGSGRVACEGGCAHNARGNGFPEQGRTLGSETREHLWGEGVW